MAVLMALCRCYESEQLIATITALCLSEDRQGPLLSAALQREIDACCMLHIFLVFFVIDSNSWV